MKAEVPLQRVGRTRRSGHFRSGRRVRVNDYVDAILLAVVKEVVELHKGLFVELVRCGPSHHRLGSEADPEQISPERSEVPRIVCQPTGASAATACRAKLKRKRGR
jgi:hypothetical protein